MSGRQRRNAVDRILLFVDNSEGFVSVACDNDVHPSIYDLRGPVIVELQGGQWLLFVVEMIYDYVISWLCSILGYGEDGGLWPLLQSIQHTLQVWCPIFIIISISQKNM